MRFDNLSYLYMLWFIPVLVGLSILGFRLAKDKIVKAFGVRMSGFLTSSLSTQKRKFKVALQVVTMALMIFAYARPQAGQSKQEVKSAGVEIVFMADVSESMMADDLRPSRLDQAKVDMSKLIDLMYGNKIGIIAFAGSANLLSPLTTDPSSLKLFTDSLSITSVSTQGTNFRDALSDAKAAFDRGGVDKESTAGVTRVIVIFSDGEDHEKGALDFAQDLTKEGIRIFTIAYGTQKGAPIPVRDSMGYLKGYKKDKSGNTILTTVNGDALRAMAEAGKGSFYFASSGGNYLQQIFNDINLLEKKEFESTVAIQYDEKFQTFLFLAFLVGLLELVLGERRSNFRLWQGRFEVPPA